MCVWVNLDFFSYESNYLGKKIPWKLYMRILPYDAAGGPYNPMIW